MRHFSRYFLGFLILGIVFFQGVRQIADSQLLQIAVVICLFILLLCIAPQVRRTVRLFLYASLALTFALVVYEPNWKTVLWSALLASSFYVAFFSALTSLRNAANGSNAMKKAGQYLANQPPGRRYLALSLGTQAYALVLNYGAIQLLGSLSVASTQTEPNPKIRQIRTRRMLLAIQRGFISSLPWSPLSFAMAISVSVIPNTSWALLALPGVVTSFIILTSGWALDTIMKPRGVSATPSQTKPKENWRVLSPLFLLLFVMLGLMMAGEWLFHIRIIGLVLIIVPLVSAVWIYLQMGHFNGFKLRVFDYLENELSTYHDELVLLTSAGYIGVVGSVLFGHFLDANHIDLTQFPTWAILLSLIYIMPILGQLGANPILSLSLIGPILPSAEQLGISPTALAVTLICGWTMTGIASPFTATNLLVARFGNIKPIEVGYKWNGVYFIVTSLILSMWSLGYAYFSV